MHTFDFGDYYLHVIYYPHCKAQLEGSSRDDSPFPKARFLFCFVFAQMMALFDSGMRVCSRCVPSAKCAGGSQEQGIITLVSMRGSPSLCSETERSEQRS